MTHRYAQSSGFTNPSVYCEALQTLIIHAQLALGKILIPSRQLETSS